MTRINIQNYYLAICKDLKIEPTKLEFKKVGKGGACILHNKNGLIYSIQIDINKCVDIERGILHEVAHKILIRKNNNFSHNKTFKNLEKRLIEKYFYSQFSKLLYNDTK